MKTVETSNNVVIEKITTRHLMAFVFGAVVPVIFASNNLPFMGLWVAGAVFCIYAFKRSDSEAAMFGMFISLCVAMLIAGSFDVHETPKQPDLVYPADCLR